MSVPAGLTRLLASELGALNDSQRLAALFPENMVASAGPGSGKTRTLVAKAAYLLETHIPPRRSLAAITFTRSAAAEITRRLETLDVRPAGRLAVGTVHGWCLRHILRPFGPLVGVLAPASGSVIDDNSPEWLELLQHCMDQTGAGQVTAFRKTEVCRIRRNIAAGVVEDDRDPVVRAATAMDRRMVERGWYDFDLMVAQSLSLLRDNPRVTHLIATKYPWLIVDEYQDLGPVLHCIVTHLHEAGGVLVAAFGDPDQTLMRFTGADPRYMRELVDRYQFAPVPLAVNYRCGSAIIAASRAAVDGHRMDIADPSRSDPGIVELITADGDQHDHARITVKRVDDLATQGVPAHHVAILYPSKGPLLDALISTLDASSHGYVHEGDQRLPASDMVDFVRGCAARAIAGPQPVGYPDVDHASAVPVIHDLVNDYLQQHDTAEQPAPTRRAATRLLAITLTNLAPETRLDAWLDDLDSALGLNNLAENSAQRRDLVALKKLRKLALEQDITVGDIAGALRTGKVTVTTYHSAKGREWDYVVLPGLIDGIMPRRLWSKQSGRFLSTPADQMQQAQHAFYVGITRAKRAVVVIEGSHWTTDWGKPNRLGVSPFSRRLRQQLQVAPTFV